MRKNRIYSNSGFYHAIIRGVNKQLIFFEDSDKYFFLSLMKKYSKKYGIKIHAYCLMDNHVHLLIQDSNKNLSSFMQLLASVYARYFNKKYDRIGHLYQDRFSSEAIENNGYLVVVFRYIIQNPQKAGLCSTADFKWNSFRLYKKKKTLVETSLLPSLFGDTNRMYRYLQEPNIDECLEISLRPSEKNAYYVNKIKTLLKSSSPIISQNQSKESIAEKIKILRKAKLSIRIISKITGISTGVVQRLSKLVLS